MDDLSNLGTGADAITIVAMANPESTSHQGSDKLWSSWEDKIHLNSSDKDSVTDQGSHDRVLSDTTILRKNIKTGHIRDSFAKGQLGLAEEYIKAGQELLGSVTGTEIDDSTKNDISEAARLAESAEKTLRNVTRRKKAIQNQKQSLQDSVAQLQNKISLYSALPSTRAEDYGYDTSHVFDYNSFGDLHNVAQLVVLLTLTCNVILGLSTIRCNFIVHAVTLIVQVAMATHLGRNQLLNHNQQYILRQLPSSLHVALNKLNIDGKTIMYAVCPSCSFTNKRLPSGNYPEFCRNVIPGELDRFKCDTKLLEFRNGQKRPIKPYVTQSFVDFLARSLSDPQVERLCDKACDDALLRRDYSHGDVSHVFNGKFMQNFQGPIPGQLFIDRKDRMRLAFSIQMDFFNPHGSNLRGNSDNVGLISFMNLGLPEDIRLRSDHIFLGGVITGRKEPDVNGIVYYLNPFMDDLLKGWQGGIRFSRTGLSPHGRDVDFAIVLSVNDLPAARKIAGNAGHTSAFLCTVCECFGSSMIYRTDTELWNRRDLNELRKQAEAYRDAPTQNEQKRIFRKYGVRWSELWRLPYWDPTQMLVIDSMHCILEGLVKYHCREVLEIDEVEARTADSGRGAYAYLYPWPQFDPRKHKIEGNKNIKNIYDIYDDLQLPIQGEGGIGWKNLTQRLKTRNLPSLRFVVESLGINRIHKEVFIVQNHTTIKKNVALKCKDDYVEALCSWRLDKPLVAVICPPKLVRTETLLCIQNVIREMTVPSWIGSVPHNYGDFGAGTIKADEWRTLSTIYLPVALTTLWGEKDGKELALNSHPLQALDHTMSLFSAVSLICRNVMTQGRANTVEKLLKEWVDNLYVTHPHTWKHSKKENVHAPTRKINVHASLHLPEFLSSYGPVSAWWTFPFERVVGKLQNINTNDQIGGSMEATILRSFTRGANLRRWLNRVDSPELICRFRDLINDVFSLHKTDTEEQFQDKVMAHYTRDGVTFSRFSTHAGNSFVLYYPKTDSAADTRVGSIQKIESIGGTVYFHIRRHAPLEKGKFDPFARFPHFPARVYSSLYLEGLDKVDADAVISHVARYEMTGDRIVAINLSRA